MTPVLSIRSTNTERQLRRVKVSQISRNPNPVSYTHLDVYKRQMKSR